MTDPDVALELDAESGVAVIELRRPPNNFLDISLLTGLTDGLAELDDDVRCNAVLVRSAGKHFCAGRDFAAPRRDGDESSAIYDRAADLFQTRKPWIAAVQGAAIGAGLGLAVAADFRVAGPRAYFWANFVNLGLHPGFGLTATLPRLLGQQNSAWMLYSGERIGADKALSWGLVDQLVDEDALPTASLDMARRLAAMPAEALQAVRRTLRGEEAVAAFTRATRHESGEQERLKKTAAHRAVVGEGA